MELNQLLVYKANKFKNDNNKKDYITYGFLSFGPDFGYFQGYLHPQKSLVYKVFGESILNYFIHSVKISEFGRD